MAATRTFAAPAALPGVIAVQAEAMWTTANPLDDDAWQAICERLADMLGLGPGDGHDELTRCEYDRCGAWLWADEGATLVYQSGTELTVCPQHAQADDPGARVYPGAGLLAVWEAQRAAEGSARIRTTGRA